MKKAIYQFLIMVAAFLLTWFLFSKINYTGHMELDEFSEEQEKKLGELLLEGLSAGKDEIKHDSINHIINNIFDKIISSNKIEKGKIKVRVFDDETVNAFALPGDQLVIFTGLINYCKTPEELAGVMAHEIAHIQKDHVMKKLIKEVGVAMLFVIVAGNGSFEIISEVLKTITSLAFDREQETVADIYAISLLGEAKINPSGLSEFLFRLSQEPDDFSDELLIISTHPGSADRSVTILEEIKKNPSKYQELHYDFWENRAKN